jgi:hypothetical protein
MTPLLKFLCEARFEVGPPVEVAAGPEGLSRMIPITGGSVTGPELQGILLPGGADWQRIRPDGTAEIEARYVVRTIDGENIAVINRGLRTGPVEAMRRLAAGEVVDPGEYYFRTSPQFQTGALKYAWLTRKLFIGMGERLPDQVVIRFWSVE